MSEYQFYEFRAIDRPLDDRQMKELRAVSSRAVITPTSFVNEYNWGDFKGNPAEWMEKYFDAFLYCANWGTRQFMLRFPKRHFNSDAAAAYFISDSAFMITRKEHVVLTIQTEFEDSDWIEAEGWLSSLIPLRTEIISGDLRCLYLAWLLCVQTEEVDDDEMEPFIPAGLEELSASEQFLLICAILRNVAEKARLSYRSVESFVGNTKRSPACFTRFKKSCDHSFLLSFTGKHCVVENCGTGDLDGAARRLSIENRSLRCCRL